jgi:hypothetical protein
MAELNQFLGADAGGAQDLDGRPGPEGAVFLGWSGCGVSRWPGAIASADVVYGY